MQVNISGHQLDVTDALRDYIGEKLGRLERHFDKITNVQVTINTEAEGLAAEEVEKLISYPVESAMYALPAVTEVRSLSRTGLSIVTVVFAEGTDIYFARQQVFEQLQAAREMIPSGVGVPEIGPNTSGLGQIYQYILRADPSAGINAAELRSLNDYLVKLILMPVGGVTDVLSFGGEVRQYQVLPDTRRMAELGVSPEQLRNALLGFSANTSGVSVTTIEVEAPGCAAIIAARVKNGSSLCLMASKTC